MYHSSGALQFSGLESLGSNYSFPSILVKKNSTTFYSCSLGEVASYSRYILCSTYHMLDGCKWLSFTVTSLVCIIRLKLMSMFMFSKIAADSLYQLSGSRGSGHRMNIFALLNPHIRRREYYRILSLNLWLDDLGDIGSRFESY